MNVDDIKVEELRDDELKNYIKNINDEHLSHIGHLSLYYSIYNSILLIKEKDEKDFIKLIKNRGERELIEKHYNDLITIVKNIDNIFLDNKDRDEVIEKIYKIRKELYNYLALLNSYIIELGYVYETFDYSIRQRIAKSKYKNLHWSDLRLNDFLQNILSFLLENTEDYNEFNYILGTIISLTPFRLTKEKFTEIVGDSLRKSLKDMPKSIVENKLEKAKNDFDSSFVKGYGIKFDDIFRQVESFKKFNIKNMTIDELEKEKKVVKEIILDVETVANAVRSLGLLTNKLYILYILKDIIRVSDINKDILNLENKNVLTDLEKQIDSYEDSIIKTVDFFQEINREAFNRGISIDEKLNAELENTREMLAYYNDIFFEKEDILYPNLDDIPDENYIEQNVNNFLQYLNRNVKHMGNLERKIRMKGLLLKLTIPFSSPDKFMNYLEGSLNIKVTSKEEIFLAIDDIHYFMNYFNEYKIKKDS
ncbi:MAG TPA: hypothetical protein VK071_07345 [Tissierellales bacterium]|nr:hypothetical protein [Tissierellales bacterium]